MEQQQCLRCRATFDSETALETHMQATDVCQPFQQLELQVFGRDIQDKLKKRSSKKSDEEKWAGVYRTLFPKDRDIPLPRKSINILKQELHVEFLFDTSHIIDHDELPLAEYRESVQHKLPGRLKDALEKLVAPDTGVASLSEPMMVEIIKVVCACSDELLREFQHAQQHEAAQYQPLGLASSETSPQVALENSFVDTGTKGSVDMLQDMVSNWNPQQPAFPEVSMPFTMEPRSSFNGSTSINYVSQHSTSSTHWRGANTGMHQSCQSQAWYPPQWSSPYLASTGGVLASTHGQFMPMLPTLTSDFAPVGDANQASAVTGTNASFTADMSIDTFHSNSPSFEF